MNEWGTPGLPLADLPASKFWPRVTDNLKLEDSDLWQEELGLHPKSPLWDGVTKMMIRSPGRETGQEMTGLHICAIPLDPNEWCDVQWSSSSLWIDNGIQVPHGTATLCHLLQTCPHLPATRNVPARCSQTEIEQLLSYVTTDFRLQMPRSSERKCKGYAFIEGLVVFEPGMGWNGMKSSADGRRVEEIWSNYH